MLVHAAHAHSTHAAAIEPQAATATGLWDGSTTGMAAHTLAYAPLIVQQNVPSIGEAQHAPKTKVDPTKEQGEGRSPGWGWGWMRKVIPYAPVTQEHKQRPFGRLRPQPAMMNAHPPGSGRQQHPAFKETRRAAHVLAQPQTTYFTASSVTAPPMMWGEPL